jgi:hypothetical protein
MPYSICRQPLHESYLCNYIMDVELLLHVYKPDRLEALLAVTMAASLATHYYSALVPGNGTMRSA